MIVYVCVGNSDDKLTQQQWARYVAEFRDLVTGSAMRTHGVWFSPPDIAYQNAVICVEFVTGFDFRDLKRELGRLAADYYQNSIAWAEVPNTEFITGTR